ncbi:MAG TPA: type II toxin-antitoxin system HicA family toxin [Candidatus Dormibacteraeota bacterium]|nr:type II toxin-antitoxin system HicA family toxin [Candidatus Dormibacteraeota bacterium]
MSKLPRKSGLEVIKALARAGFQVTGRAKHGAILRHPDGRRTVVPLHPELDRGTLQAIINQAGLTREQFMSLL